MGSGNAITFSRRMCAALQHPGAGISVEMPLPLTRRAFWGAVCRWQTSRADRSEAETPVPPEAPSALRGGAGQPQWGPTEAQQSGFGGERRNAGMGELSAKREASDMKAVPTREEPSDLPGPTSDEKQNAAQPV